MQGMINFTIAKSQGSVFNSASAKDALIYTNTSQNIFIGSSNGSYMSLSSNGTLTTSNLNVTGTISGSIDGSCITGTITNAQINTNSITGTITASTLSSALTSNLGGTGVTTGLTQLNATNFTTGTLSNTFGGTGATSLIGSGLNVLNSNPTFDTLSNIGVLSNAGIMYTNQLSNFGGIDATGQTVKAQTLIGNLDGVYITGTITNAQINSSQITGTITASNLSTALATTLGGTGVTTGLTQLNADNFTSGTLSNAFGGTGVTTGLSQLNATNITLGTLSTTLGGTGVASGLTQLNATNFTSGTLSNAFGGTGATNSTGFGLNVLNNSSTFATLSNIGVLSNAGIMYTNQLSNFGGIDATGQTVKAQTLIGNLDGAYITGTITNAQINSSQITGTITASNLSTALATTLGGTGVTTGLTQLIGDNFTSGTLSNAFGGTGATQIIGSGTNVLNSNPTFNAITNIGILSNVGIVYTNQMSNWGGIVSTRTITAPTFSGNATSATSASLCTGSASNITGTLAVAQGGTGATQVTGSGTTPLNSVNVLNSNPTFNSLSNVGVLSNAGIVYANQIYNYGGIDVVSGNIINRNSTSSALLIGTTTNPFLQGCTVINSSTSNILNMYANNACLRIMGIQSDGQTNSINKSGDCAIMASTGTVGGTINNDTGGLTLGPWVATAGVARGIRIDGPTGNVGMGLSNPAYALDVAGNINCTGIVSANNIGMFRNRIINGDMRINQRGFSGLNATNVNVYEYDRWLVKIGTFTTALNANSMSDSTMISYGFKNFLSIGVSSAINTSYIIPSQTIEGYNISDLNWGTTYGSYVTLSFWGKTVSSGANIPISIKNATSSHTYLSNLQTNAADTWQYYKCTIPPPPSGSVWSSNNTAGIVLSIGAYSLSGTTTSTGWLAGDYYSSSNCYNGTYYYVQFTGVQLEKGTIATPFELRPFATELQLCQRYYSSSYPYGVAIGTSITSACTVVSTGMNVAWPITYPVPARLGYTIDIYGGLTGTKNKFNMSNAPSTDYAINFSSTNLTNGSFVYSTNAIDQNVCLINWVMNGDF